MTQRTKDLAKIHIAKKALCLSDADYEAVLRFISKGRTSSSADLSDAERTALLKHFWRKGWRPAPRTKAAAHAGSATRTRRDAIHADSPEAKKARALWILLHELGQVRDPSERALTAYCKRNLHVDSLRFTDQLWRLIESLKDWAMRALPQAVAAQENALRGIQLPQQQAHEITQARMLLKHAIAVGHRHLFNAYLPLYQAQKLALQQATQHTKEGTTHAAS